MFLNVTVGSPPLDWQRSLRGLTIPLSNSQKIFTLPYMLTRTLARFLKNLNKIGIMNYTSGLRTAHEDAIRIFPNRVPDGGAAGARLRFFLIAFSMRLRYYRTTVVTQLTLDNAEIC